MAGVSLAGDNGAKIYLPIGHPEDNVDPAAALRYIKHQLGGDEVKVGANLMYDLESLWSVGVEVRGPLADIQIAEPLIDEERPGGFSLQNLAQLYLKESKNEDLLRTAASDYGVDAKGGLALIPARFVGPYAEDDALLPLRIFEEQQKELASQDLMRVFTMERELQRVLFLMRLKGVRVDLSRAEEVSAQCLAREQELQSAIDLEAGYHVQVASSEKLGVYFKNEGLDPPVTPKAKKYSVTNDWLSEHSEHKVAALAMEFRKSQKMRRDFIDKLREDEVDGRIYTNWRQMRDYGEDGQSTGTRSGRIAASEFNLTQVPARDPHWGPIIRSLFVADEGAMGWCKADYSQQEPRILLHFAYLMSQTDMGQGRYAGAAEARQLYINEPSTDYHQMVADLVYEKSGQDIGRRSAKDINLGSAYGMGKPKLASKLGVSLEVAEEIFKAYHTGVPYVSDLSTDMGKLAAQRGYIRTYLGRRRHYNEWEPSDWEARRGQRPLRNADEAKTRWQRIQRAYTHKAMNSSVQGTAADQMKTALLLLHKEHGFLPQIQVYDEINSSVGSDAEVRLIKTTMEEALPMEVPFLVEPELGTSWGTTKEYE